MDRAITACEKNLRPNLAAVVADVFNATGTETARRLRGQLMKAAALRAAFNPDQPRDKDGKWGDGGGPTPAGQGGHETPEAQFAAAESSYPKLALTERDVSNTTLPRDSVYKGDVVDGLRVRTDIPNTDSISATFNEDEYETLPGLRQVPLSDLGVEGNYKSADDNARVTALVEKIRASGEIAPLIVVNDSKGTYVLEGNHRARALYKMGKTSAPALVVVHYDQEAPRANSIRAAFNEDQPRDGHKKLRGASADLRGLAPAEIGGFAFDKTNPSAVQWIADHTAETIDGISATTRERIKDLVEQEFLGDFDADELTDRITELLGDPERAELIARTETMRASNEGQQEAWDQAVDAGLLTGNEQQEWIVTPDDRLCPVCEPMDGVTTDLDGTFDVDGDEIDGPPAHPRCRCTLGLKLGS